MDPSWSIGGYFMFSKKYLILAGLLASSATAFAHPSFGVTANADKSSKIVMGMGHGCNGNTEDTWKVRVDIPAGVTGVRALFSDFGKPTVIRTAGVVTAIEWTKSDDDKLAADDAYYELAFRARMPNTPYTKLQFNVLQTCVDASGNPTTPVPWDQPPGSTTGEPAPLLTVLPDRLNATGWNKLTIPANTTVAAADLGVFFADALIVWKGTSAFSKNPNTVEQILATSGVTMLNSDLVAGDVIWVRY
jgi:uncharacterized protein YcnI